MATNSFGNSVPNSHRFFQLFRQHWEAGTGLAAHNPKLMKQHGQWTNQAFGDAMQRAASIPTIDPHTIRSWLSGERWPRTTRKDAIVKVFFRLPKGVPNDDTIARMKEEFEQAWKDGQSQYVSTTWAARARDEEADAPKRWLPAEEPFAITGLASVRLTDPQQGNDPASGWFIKARLRIDPAEYELDDGSTVFVAIQDALLKVSATGYQVATRSIIGVRDEHPNFRVENDNDSVAVVGPALEGRLEGDLAGDDTIAQIVPTAESTGEETVSVSLHAFRRSFIASLTRTPSDCIGFNEKQAVINRLIELRRERDAQGRVLLARHSLQRTKIE